MPSTPDPSMPLLSDMPQSGMVILYLAVAAAGAIVTLLLQLAL